VPAAYHGRVYTLFVAKVLRRWGYLDPKTVAAVQTRLTGGTVYTADPGEMPADGPVASVFRY
jgi:hypothetical protein